MITCCLCPGIHDRQLTDSFLASLASQPLTLDNLLVLPTAQYPPFSSWHVLHFWQQHLQPPTDNSLIVISFSAGVVGAIGSAWMWQQAGGKILAFIALDGWGVPLFGSFPIHRLSHDAFTHWSSALLGAGEESFYAEPPASHLDLWQSPAGVAGWMVEPAADGKTAKRSQTNAAAFLASLLRRYSEVSD